MKSSISVILCMFLILKVWNHRVRYLCKMFRATPSIVSIVCNVFFRLTMKPLISHSLYGFYVMTENEA